VSVTQKLAEDTSDLVNIRATGHGWCLASDAGCGGQGLYEPTRCLGCGNGLIDNTYPDIAEPIRAKVGKSSRSRLNAERLERAPFA
jgi:hypothetical protein